MTQLQIQTFRNQAEQALRQAPNASPQELHQILSDAIMACIRNDWDESREAHLSARRACYFSMEFLVGRAIYNNLLCLGLADTAEEVLSSAGRSLSELEEIEDAALGNGGLGRLAACFLDSAAAHNLPLDGYGIRYRYGLFRQHFENGFQTEEPDDWTRFGDPWSVRNEAEAVHVCYEGQVVKAVPYDMPIIGYGTRNVGTLRLWQAEPTCPFDFKAFNEQDYLGACANIIDAENISRCLYPNDDGDAGKRLRLKQQYFFCSASLQDILKKHVKSFGTLENLADMITIQLNDTHPVISIPELIRLLMKESMTFEHAFGLACKIFRYTNHTIMAEALETWDAVLMESLLPEIYAIILRIHEQLLAERYAAGDAPEEIEALAIVQKGRVHMAHMAIYVSAYTNGVARLHTEILKKTALHPWYQRYPERFFNETNGITQRRWLALCNRELSELITEKLGSNAWITDLSRLKELEPFETDEAVLGRFLAVKAEKKRQLATYIKDREGISIDSTAIFDIQIKRLHEYKRQLLNAFSILWIYFGLKDGTIQDFTPTVFLFGAKSAPGYRRAKAIIKYINEIAKLIAADESVRNQMQVVFVQNYDVSYAEKLVAAADISEQISTAGTEASGTGNMKLMLNGAVTLGTYDGANVEIAEEAGMEHNYIFGARVEELNEMEDYCPRRLIAEKPMLRRVVSTLIDGTVSDGGTGDFRELYTALLDGASWHKPDHYYLLGDLEAYVEAKLRANAEYRDRTAFAKKQWHNMCNAGKFSSDRTIQGYAEEIWQIEPVSLTEPPAKIS